jgi:hypothetical protein
MTTEDTEAHRGTAISTKIAIPKRNERSTVRTVGKQRIAGAKPQRLRNDDFINLLVFIPRPRLQGQLHLICHESHKPSNVGCRTGPGGVLLWMWWANRTEPAAVGCDSEPHQRQHGPAADARRQCRPDDFLRQIRRGKRPGSQRIGHHQQQQRKPDHSLRGTVRRCCQRQCQRKRTPLEIW